jgi:hypothetical protein
MSVYEAINNVMDEVRSVAKNDKNTQQNFNFRGIDAVVNAVSPAMRKHGLTVRPSNVLSIEHLPFTSKSGALGVACRVLVEYTFTDLKGDECTSVVAAEANDYGDKATPKAMSVAFRTCLLQAFALPTTETDPDADTYDHGERPQATVAGPKRTIQRQAVDIDAVQARMKECATVDELRALYDAYVAEGAPDSVLALVSAEGKARAAA